MSRYVTIEAGLHSLAECTAALTEVGIAFEHGRTRQMLAGSVECVGEPVDVLVAAGTAGAVEDFGFVADGGGVKLVCGELDRPVLEGAVLEPLRRAAALSRVRTAARHEGLEIEAEVERGGEVKVRLKR